MNDMPIINHKLTRAILNIFPFKRKNWDCCSLIFVLQKLYLLNLDFYIKTLMQFQISCPNCSSINNSLQTNYNTKNNGVRRLLKCNDCQRCYSETCNTFMFNIKYSISKIAMVIKARTEGMSFNATCRIHEISAHTLQSWEIKFSQLKDTLMAYTLSHAFISLTIEGDELYTKIGKNVP